MQDVGMGHLPQAAGCVGAGQKKVGDGITSEQKARCVKGPGTRKRIIKELQEIVYLVCVCWGMRDKTLEAVLGQAAKGPCKPV